MVTKLHHISNMLWGCNSSLYARNVSTVLTGLALLALPHLHPLCSPFVIRGYLGDSVLAVESEAVVGRLVQVSSTYYN